MEDIPDAYREIGIYAGRADISAEAVLNEFGGRQFSEFKPVLADLAVEKLAPITAEMRRLMDDPAEIERLLRGGAERAEAIASDNLVRVYNLVGFLPR